MSRHRVLPQVPSFTPSVCVVPLEMEHRPNDDALTPTVRHTAEILQVRHSERIYELIKYFAREGGVSERDARFRLCFSALFPDIMTNTPTATCTTNRSTHLGIQARLSSLFWRQKVYISWHKSPKILLNLYRLSRSASPLLLCWIIQDREPLTENRGALTGMRWPLITSLYWSTALWGLVWSWFILLRYHCNTSGERWGWL